MGIGGIFILWLVIGFISGLICAAIASGKNLNGAGWFFAGLFLGPFAILFVAIASPGAPVAQLQPWRCQKCGQVNPYWSNVCVCKTPRQAVPETKKCPDCAEQIKYEANVCRFCGHKFPEPELASVSSPATTPVARPASAKKSKVGIVVVLAVVFLGILVFEAFAVLDPGLLRSGRGQSTVSKSLDPPQKVRYKITREWKLSDGGFGRVVVVDRSLRSVNGLESLGDNLRYAARNDGNAIVYVFDDAKAAAMQAVALTLQGSDANYYDRHLVGQYAKNSKTGFHKLKITLDGQNGQSIDVEY